MLHRAGASSLPRTVILVVESLAAGGSPTAEEEELRDEKTNRAHYSKAVGNRGRGH
jgi:hypothetical protein